MGEGKAHKAIKSKIAGETGKKEVSVGENRIDVMINNKAVEVERSRNYKKAIKRLEKATVSYRELRVPQNEMELAKEEVKRISKKPIVVSNLTGSKKI